MDFYSDVLELILCNKIRTKNELHNAKIELCRKYKLHGVPSDADILEHAPGEIYDIVEPMLRTKPMRTISGVAPIAVMTSPADCPHGVCSYCPGGVEYGSAQSYTGFEPAALRAASNDFDPFFQVKSRLEQLSAIGHPTDKIDLIIMGGTFTSREERYQDTFISGCLSALNGNNSWDQSLNLEAQKAGNETGPHRCIGMTIETRPDWCKIPQVDQILKLGGTRVELGVQTIHDDILEQVNRGHKVSDSIEATQILKDSGFKVCYHLMPGLPGVSLDMDKKVFDELFSDPNFMPDMLKIYPTLVVKGTPLYDSWKAEEYAPLDTESAVGLLAYLKTQLPPWVRIQRIQRDIPVQYIEAGVEKSNLRQLVHGRLEEKGEKCNCIRCREVGHLSLKGIEPQEEYIELQKIIYEASEGTEIFLSYEDLKNNILIAFARLRIVSNNAHRAEFYGKTNKNIQKTKPNSAIIRELKVFGPMAVLKSPKNDKNKQPDSEQKFQEWQHQGYGQLLLEGAEKVASENWDAKKMLIMSGVGVKQYYSKLGYKVDGVYMGKMLK
jgi:elongator complex protein 3